MDVWRPCDTVETARGLGGGDRAPARPDAACCSRGRTCRSCRATPPDRGDPRAAAMCSPIDAAQARARSIIATGSEVALALGAREALAERGVAVRVVSMPCTQRLRPPGRRLSRGRAAARRAARRGRGRRHRLLAQVRRAIDDPRRRGRRHRHASANRRRPASCSSTSASPSNTSSPPSGASPDGMTTHGDSSSAAPRRATPRRSRSVRVDGWRTTYSGLIPAAYLDGDAGRGQHGAVGTRYLPRAPNTGQRVCRGSATASVIGFAAGAMLRRAEASGSTPSCTAVYLAASSQRARTRTAAGAACRRGTARSRRDRHHRLGHRRQQGRARILRGAGRGAAGRAGVPHGMAWIWSRPPTAGAISDALLARPRGRRPALH